MFGSLWKNKENNDPGLFLAFLDKMTKEENDLCDKLTSGISEYGEGKQ